jgi:hypothetical protein
MPSGLCWYLFMTDEVLQVFRSSPINWIFLITYKEFVLVGFDFVDGVGHVAFVLFVHCRLICD